MNPSLEPAAAPSWRGGCCKRQRLSRPWGIFIAASKLQLTAAPAL